MVAISIGLGFAICEGFGNEFQLPFWGLLLACALVLLFLPALGVILAISGNVIIILFHFKILTLNQNIYTTYY